MAYNIKKNETNTKLVEKYMDWGSPLNQAFLIQAVNEYAERVIAQKEQLIQQENSFINPHAWVKCAEDWEQCLEDRK